MSIDMLYKSISFLLLKEASSRPTDSLEDALILSRSCSYRSRYRQPWRRIP